MILEWMGSKYLFIQQQWKQIFFWKHKVIYSEWLDLEGMGGLEGGTEGEGREGDMNPATKFSPSIDLWGHVLATDHKAPVNLPYLIPAYGILEWHKKVMIVLTQSLPMPE